MILQQRWKRPNLVKNLEMNCFEEVMNGKISSVLKPPTIDFETTKSFAKVFDQSLRDPEIKRKNEFVKNLALYRPEPEPEKVLKQTQPTNWRELVQAHIPIQTPNQKQRPTRQQNKSFEIQSTGFDSYRSFNLSPRFQPRNTTNIKSKLQSLFNQDENFEIENGFINRGLKVARHKE